MSGTLTIGGKTYTITLEEISGSANSGVEESKEKMNGGAKKKKQEGGKTRKLSPYMKFAQKARPELLKENPALRSDIPGMGRAIGAKWRALSEDEKKKY